MQLAQAQHYKGRGTNLRGPWKYLDEWIDLLVNWLIDQLGGRQVSLVDLYQKTLTFHQVTIGKCLRSHVLILVVASVSINFCCRITSYYPC